MRTSNNDKPRRNVADTSIECYRQIKREGQIKRETELVLECLTNHQPLTSRAVMTRTGKERGNICRSLFNLEKSGIIKIAFTEKCKITNKRVRYYALTDWQQSA